MDKLNGDIYKYLHYIVIYNYLIFIIIIITLLDYYFS